MSYICALNFKVDVVINKDFSFIMWLVLDL